MLKRRNPFAGRVPLDVIKRWGRWCEGMAVLLAYLTNAPPDGLLAMAGFGYHTGDAMKGKFWAPRLMAALPKDMMEELCLVLFPFLRELRAKVEAAKAAGDHRSISACNCLEVFTFLAETAVQDSLDQADSMPSNPIVQHFKDNPTWCRARAAYRMCLETGVSDLVARSSGGMLFLTNMGPNVRFTFVLPSYFTNPMCCFLARFHMFCCCRSSSRQSP